MNENAVYYPEIDFNIDFFVGQVFFITDTYYRVCKVNTKDDDEKVYFMTLNMEDTIDTTNQDVYEISELEIDIWKNFIFVGFWTELTGVTFRNTIDFRHVIPN